MKNSGYIMGSLEALVGCIILSVTSVIREVLPQLGRIAFQRAMAGGYSAHDYQVSFSVATTIAIILIVLGVAQILYFLIKKN